MASEKLKLCDIKTVGLFIFNDNPPINEENLQLEIKRKINAVKSGFVCNIAVIVFKEAEAEAEKKTFQIKYEVSAVLNTLEEVESIESIQDDAVAIVFPYVRANIAAITSITCSTPITLPCLDIL